MAAYLTTALVVGGVGALHPPTKQKGCSSKKNVFYGNVDAYLCRSLADFCR